MNKFKLSTLIDTFFIFFASLFFFYALFLYNAKSYFLATTLSVLLSVIISTTFLVITLLKSEAKFLKDTEQNLIKAFNYRLFIMPIKDILQLLESYYSKQNKKLKILENSIILENENINIVPVIKPEEVCLSDIIKVYTNSNSADKIIIIGARFNDNTETFIEELSLNITILSTNELYFNLKNYNLLPENLEIKPVKKKRLLSVIKGLFVKKHAKRFLFSGAIITATSFFSFYPIYYIVLGGLLLITSVIVRLFGKSQILVQN